MKEKEENSKKGKKRNGTKKLEEKIQKRWLSH